MSDELHRQEGYEPNRLDALVGLRVHAVLDEVITRAPVHLADQLKAALMANNIAFALPPDDRLAIVVDRLVVARMPWGQVFGAFDPAEYDGPPSFFVDLWRVNHDDDSDGELA